LHVPHRARSQDGQPYRPMTCCFPYRGGQDTEGEACSLHQSGRRRVPQPHAAYIAERPRTSSHAAQRPSDERGTDPYSTDLSPTSKDLPPMVAEMPPRRGRCRGGDRHPLRRRAGTGTHHQPSRPAAMEADTWSSTQRPENRDFLDAAPAGEGNARRRHPDELSGLCWTTH
jgi:hypothetical protein